MTLAKASHPLPCPPRAGLSEPLEASLQLPGAELMTLIISAWWLFILLKNGAAYCVLLETNYRKTQNILQVLFSQIAKYFPALNIGHLQMKASILAASQRDRREVMLVKEAAAEVGSMTALAKLLGVDLSVLYRWGEELPESRFYQLEGLRAHGKMPKKKRERKVSA